MKIKSSSLVIIIIVLIMSGCNNTVEYKTLLTPPQGVSALALDNQVYIKWDHTYYEAYGYRVYVNSSYNGNYTPIGTTRANQFVDQNARNGITYYYAVTTYDIDGNESDLSIENVYATPRPEVANIVLNDRQTNPNKAGYEFSTNTILPFNNPNTDIYIDWISGQYFMVVYEDTDIQDMGYTASFDEIKFSPTKGWSPLKEVLLIEGHTYVVWTFDNHYAKIRIKQINSNNIVFDCSYQTAVGNTQLKRSPAKDKRIFATNDEMKK